MNIKPYLPSLPELSREVITIMCATVVAAWVISRFPAVRQFVQQNSINVHDDGGNTLI